jgi:hypothetical protein
VQITITMSMAARRAAPERLTVLPGMHAPDACACTGQVASGKRLVRCFEHRADAFIARMATSIACVPSHDIMVIDNVVHHVFSQILHFGIMRNTV